MINANPSVDPANLDSLTGAFKEIFKKFMQGVDGMLPCEVLAFNRATPNRVQVQHLILQVTTDGATVSRGQIASLPVFQFGGGGFVISVPLKVGDLGWVIANDRDISNFTRSGETSQPNTYRIKNFADGVFFPDKMRGYEISEEDEDSLVIQSEDGLVKITMSPIKIKLIAPDIELDASTSVTVTTPQFTIDGDLITTGAMSAEGGFTGSGGGSNTATFTGNLYIDGNIAATGSITPDVPPEG